jgi:hypothetical protein
MSKEIVDMPEDEIEEFWGKVSWMAEMPAVANGTKPTTPVKPKATKVAKITVADTDLEIESLIPAIAELERTIEYLNTCTFPSGAKLDIKNMRITPIIQTQGGRDCYGAFTPGIWITVHGESHEIKVSAEHLNRPAILIAATVLHELVHAWNFSHSIDDCSNRGLYHSGKFKDAAERFGLQCPEFNKKNGHGITYLTPAMEAQIIAELQPREEAFTLCRQVIEKKENTKTKNKQFKWICDCNHCLSATEVNFVCQNCGVKLHSDAWDEHMVSRQDYFDAVGIPAINGRRIDP